ncbi:thioredoxin fold domain-containing protein [Thiohalocapsa marina]|uniref:Thioredoxin fold domain-containing protein n=1 Tax=Thiohalocapsa marina TaxID=424902 RepID=A0A5M8FV67_9GAMM|nr:thioredoxin fold domain-containing protein [Thiohalocapsa marina]KAA6187718.1 thioredoxin fold domain-containing protein [Thiohalocapsa marina]
MHHDPSRRPAPTATRALNLLGAAAIIVSLTLAATPAATLADAPAAVGGALDAQALYGFDDFPRETVLEYPSWFKTPFLDLPADQAEAVANGRNLVVYFGQKRCAYCHQLMDVNFGLPDIVAYTRKHFDIVPMDVWGVGEVTDLQGQVLTERQFALREKTNFTPSLLFYDAQGNEVLRLRGYYPPYQFRAALEYVADAHYRNESFPDYLARGDNRMVFEPGDLNEADFFVPPPYDLNRTLMPSERPLAVFFEQGDCHACDVLHGQALREPTILRQFAQIDSVQLDMWADTPVITPSGERTTAHDWARELGLFYAPSVLFFDEQGRELLRVDSVVGFYRLRSVLNYIATKAYLDQPDYQRWRLSQAF